MLKLTNSFYRYLMVTCESFHYNSHVRVASHIRESRARCGVGVGEKRRHHTGNLQKRSQTKITPLNGDHFDKKLNMSQLLPTGNYVSHGGNFQVSGDDDQPNRDRNRGGSATGGEIDSKEDCFRVWETIAKQTISNHSINSFKFKVISYNVLAQYLLECHPYLYTNCSPRNLKWEDRFALMYNQIVYINADIICLQEVQASHLDSYFSKFEELGYCGVYKQKTGQRIDGCAIYYKRALFEMIDHVNVEFYQPEIPILNRDNVGMIVKLQPCDDRIGPVVVATTHLLYNPKRTDVRLAQLKVFLAEIDRFAWRDDMACHLPIILTGDLNSTPESAVIKLLDKGHVNVAEFFDLSDWQRIAVTDNCQHLAVYLNRRKGKPTDIKDIKIRNTDISSISPVTPPRPEDQKYSALFNTDDIAHPLRLLSVYNKYKSDGRSEASTYQEGWVTVDYMYFSCCSNLYLRERYRLPTASECSVIGPIPNDTLGSDHLLLAAKFELTSQSEFKIFK